MYAYAKAADFEFPREKVGRAAGRVASLDRQLVNSQALYKMYS